MKNETINEETKVSEEKTEQEKNVNQAQEDTETCHCEHEKNHRDKKHKKCCNKEYPELAPNTRKEYC